MSGIVRAADLSGLASDLRGELAAGLTSLSDRLREEWRRDIGVVHDILRGRDEDRLAELDVERAVRERARATIPEVPVSAWVELQAVMTRLDVSVQRIETRLARIEAKLEG